VQKRPEAFVPIGNDSELESAGLEEFEGSQNVIKDAPGFGPTKLAIQFGKEVFVERRMGQPKECFIDQVRPFGTCVGEVDQIFPRSGELAIESLNWHVAQTVARRDGSIDMADGRPWLNKRAANIKRDGANWQAWINGLMDCRMDASEWRSIR